LVMWVADTDEVVDDVLRVDVHLRSVTETMASGEDIVWATHDLDRESVCFSLMVDSWARGADDGLADARLRARRCLRRCLSDAGLLGTDRRRGNCPSPPLRLRLDPGPLCLRAMRPARPTGEAMN
jgi:hypothetical protein